MYKATQRRGKGCETTMKDDRVIQTEFRNV